MNATCGSAASPATVVPFALGAPARLPAHLLGVLRERLARVTLPAPWRRSRWRATRRRRCRAAIWVFCPATMPMPSKSRCSTACARGWARTPLTRLVPLAEHRPELAMRDSRGAAPGRGGRKPRTASERRRAALRGRGACRTHPAHLAAGGAAAARASVETQPWVLRDGPERIESGWWDGADVRRDYFIATTPAGETVWIYRDHRYGIDDGEWFLHGLFA